MAVLVMRFTAGAATSAGPTTRLISLILAFTLAAGGGRPRP